MHTLLYDCHWQSLRFLIRCAEHHPFGNPRRLAIRYPKMFRFSGIYKEKALKFLECKRSKIGTFLDAGWRGGAGDSKGDMPFRNVPFSRLLLVLFLATKKSTLLHLGITKKYSVIKQFYIVQNPGYKNGKRIAFLRNRQ